MFFTKKIKWKVKIHGISVKSPPLGHIFYFILFYFFLEFS